ncbi:MAG: single-stranded-DNA-specific exonuclease RecJ [Anaerolineae bacterium]|nr:single-stranded-DNA-specific exonuclease RecJ [Anaerolineae bacterium]MDW8069494.1 single-stranded-DNA-specific exonuclease RecJ [Anaerolineae bacterium]
MRYAKYRWQIAPPAPEPYRSRLSDLHPLVVQILYNRGLTDPEAARAFLERRAGPDNPFVLRGMHRAVARIRQAVRQKEPIAVYGDFDADGVTATALLVIALQALGADVRSYIPHRVEEGYGLNRRAIEELAGAGIRLLVTVDCGIRFPREVAHARRLGMDVIVTDHHLVGTDPLAAVAVVNPQQEECPYPYKGLAGVGLAYKLAQALLRANRRVPLPGSIPLDEEELLDLVALGTVADLAPLTGENRYLVSRGLERLNCAPRVGVDALIRASGLRPGEVDTWAIGYVLGPRLNAAGRMAHAELAYRLLTTGSPEEAEHLARELDTLNQERQRWTKAMQERARAFVREREADALLLFIADPEFPTGVVGLVASRLVEEFYRPVVVVEQGEEVSKGSARSIPEFHITRALDECADLLIRYGGHTVAAGFTVLTRHLEALKHRLLNIAARELAGRELVPYLTVDAEIPLQQVNWPLWTAIQALCPFGAGNPEPLFLSRNVQVRRAAPAGADNAHLRLSLSDGWAIWDGIAFRQGEWAEQMPERVDVVYHLRRSDWNGEPRLRLEVRDWQPARGRGF